MTYKEASNHKVQISFEISLRDLQLFRNAISDLGNYATKGQLSFMGALLDTLSPDEFRWFQRVKFPGNPDEVLDEYCNFSLPT